MLRQPIKLHSYKWDACVIIMSNDGMIIGYFLLLQLFVVSMSEPRLPLQIEDASRPETDEVFKHIVFVIHPSFHPSIHISLSIQKSIHSFWWFMFFHFIKMDLFDTQLAHVNQDTRLDNRIIDLRVSQSFNFSPFTYNLGQNWLRQCMQVFAEIRILSCHHADQKHCQSPSSLLNVVSEDCLLSWQ